MTSKQITHDPSPICVGFVLPVGTRSDAKNTTTPGRAIDLTAEPWGFTGADGSLEFSPTDSENYRKFSREYNKRYGQITPTAAEGSAIAVPESLSSEHWTAFESALTTIATLDPAWFALHGYGTATGGTQPSRQESIDAWMTGVSGPGRAVLDHASELNKAQGSGSAVTRPSRPAVSHPPAPSGGGPFISPSKPAGPGEVGGTVGPSGDPSRPGPATDGTSTPPLPSRATVGSQTAGLGKSAGSVQDRLAVALVRFDYALHDMSTALLAARSALSSAQASGISTTSVETAVAAANDRWVYRLRLLSAGYRAENPPRERLAKDVEAIITNMTGQK